MENITKSNNKPTLIVHENKPDCPLAKSLWSLLAGHDIRFVSSKNREELLSEAPTASLIILCTESPGDEVCQLAHTLSMNQAITAELAGFAPNASVEERVKYLTYGFDYAFNHDFMKFPDFRQVVLSKLQRGARRIENRAQDEEYRRFRASLSASPDAFIVLDENRKIFFVSHHYKRAYPQSAHKLVRGLDIMDAFEILSKEQGVTESDPRYPQLKKFWVEMDGTQEFETIDGRIWRMRASKLDEGQGIIITTTDLTLYMKQKREIEKTSSELKAALKNEKEASALQKQFIDMVSHEFRTPLTIIDGHAQILSRKADEISPEDIRKRTRTIRSAVTRLVTMMEGVLSSNMLKIGKLEIVPEPINLKTYARDLCDDHIELARSHKLVLNTDQLPETVKIDRKILNLIMSNLISNAIKYTTQNPEIKVDLSVKDSWLTIKVHDNGVGIPYEELPRIFERYFRASTATGIPGTGIGLSLVKELVELYHGKLEVSSDIGQGTEFSVSLPVGE